MEMYYCNGKGGIHTPALILAMLMMIMMLLDAYCCGASVLAKTNTSFRCSSGRLDECLIEEDLELELGFLMSPYVSRILLETGTGSTGNSGKPAAKPCGGPNDNVQYCTTNVKPSQKQKPCTTYDRSCKSP
ncbi:hypothetical protein I3843_03G116200 [Carya illinoinensis]|uniref:Rapid ALkalinization Factor n=1 Tax=Carya illinoinensis TaxID=32201 RepID=A0A922JUS6_CARIL|nr:hypothetical protein I3842_03G117100 [Carya illinoinensis]KAG7987111.1 hypothetical protein I3843_03G116200 [Carya illinoinensis]